MGLVGMGLRGLTGKEWALYPKRIRAGLRERAVAAAPEPATVRVLRRRPRRRIPLQLRDRHECDWCLADAARTLPPIPACAVVLARRCAALQHPALCSGPVTVQRILRGLHGSQQKSLNWLSMRRAAGAAAASACDSADHPDLRRRPNTAPEMVSRPCPTAQLPRCHWCHPTLCRRVRDGLARSSVLRHTSGRASLRFASRSRLPKGRVRTAPHRTARCSLHLGRAGAARGRARQRFWSAR